MPTRACGRWALYMIVIFASRTTPSAFWPWLTALSARVLGASPRSPLPSSPIDVRSPLGRRAPHRNVRPQTKVSASRPKLCALRAFADGVRSRAGPLGASQVQPWLVAPPIAAEKRPVPPAVAPAATDRHVTALKGPGTPLGFASGGRCAPLHHSIAPPCVGPSEPSSRDPQRHRPSAQGSRLLPWRSVAHPPAHQGLRAPELGQEVLRVC